MDFYSKANKVLHLIHFFQLFNPICPKWFSLHTDEFEQPGRAEATHRSNDSSYLHTRVSIDHYFPNEQVYFPGNESPVYGGCSLELTICKSSPRCQGWWSKIQFSITTMISSHPPFFFLVFLKLLHEISLSSEKQEILRMHIVEELCLKPFFSFLFFRSSIRIDSNWCFGTCHLLTLMLNCKSFQA